MMKAWLSWDSVFLVATTAAEITVISAGAVEPGLKPASLAFEKRGSHREDRVCPRAADTHADRRGEVGRR